MAKLWLDKNECPSLGHRVMSSCRDVDIEQLSTRYPDESKLISQIAALEGVSIDQVLLTSGAEDGLRRVVMLNSMRGKGAIYHSPTFPPLESCLENFCVQMRRVTWLNGEFPLGRFRKEIDRDTGLLSFVSPNNPTGLIIPKQVIWQLAQEYPHVLILIDNVYGKFSTEDYSSVYLFPNVIVVRSMSKELGIPGLRVGYVIAHREVVMKLIPLGPQRAVNALALEVARRGLADLSGVVARHHARIISNRQRIQAFLSSCDASFLPSEGNFVFVRPVLAYEFSQFLLEGGIVIKSFEEESVVSGWVRITVPDCSADCETLLLRLRGGLSFLAPNLPIRERERKASPPL